MTLTYYHIDAFTDQTFGGNPAIVVPLQEWLADEVLQRISAEFNQSETAFILPQDDGYAIRWLTPELEMDLCGHATLAAARVVFDFLEPNRRKIDFYTRQAGTLTVYKKDRQIELDFPSRPALPARMTELIQVAFHPFVPVGVWKSRDYLIEFQTESEIAQLKPNIAQLMELDAAGVIATAKGDSVDFVSRFFAPAVGLNEDPVTGSAHCTLIPFWAERLGKTELMAEQLSARKGKLWCTLDGDRVRMAGDAVVFAKGELFIPE